MREWLGLPVQASAHANGIDHVLVIEHWMMLGLFVFWFAYLIYALVRFRKGASPAASYTGMRSRWAFWVVGGIVGLEAVLLVGYEIPFWKERTQPPPEGQQAVIVRVVAEQFSWNIHYPGPDGQFGRTDLALVAPDNPLGLDRRDPAAKDDITTINDLVLPVNRTVLIHLTSKDVIHSFGVVAMRIRQDAIPGQRTPVWFVPTTTGQFEIACSQLCGLGHYRMRGALTVKTEAEYAAWLREQAEPAP